MGGYFSTSSSNHDEEIQVTSNSCSTPRKRKHETEEINAEEHEKTPRKKMKTTSEYIYRTLFISGENSDVTLKALAHEWKLHKIYLCQSPYFRSMFKGQWVEREQTDITINVPDNLITIKALDIAFGSLYSYEVDVIVLTQHLIPVLAASRMFQLDGLLQHCEDSMLETICADNVCRFYDAASRYDLHVVQERCFSWLERNFLLCRTSVLAKHLSEHLLKRLLTSKDFVVMQVEMDVYNFLKIWLYLQLHPECEMTLKSLVSETQRYFQTHILDAKKEFLLTDVGQRYASVFQCLRIQNMLGDIKCIRLITKDCIIPKEWLLPLYEWQWQKMLSVYSGEDSGPHDVEIDRFEKSACRCGRILETDSRLEFDGIVQLERSKNLYLSIHSSELNINSVSSETKSQTVSDRSTKLHPRKNTSTSSHLITYHRFKAFNLNDSGQEVISKDTGLLHWNFHTDEEIPIMNFDQTWTFPIYISARLMLTSTVYKSKTKNAERL